MQRQPTDNLQEDPSYGELKNWHGPQTYRVVVHTVMRLVFAEDAEGFFRLPYDLVRCVFELFLLQFNHENPTGRFYKFTDGVLPRELSNPTSVCHAGNGAVVIAQRGLARLILWHVDQRKPSVLVRKGPPFDSIDSLVMLDEQTLAVTDSEANCVFVIEVKENGRILRKLGGYGYELELFRQPRGVALTEDNRLVVCDYQNNRIQFIDPTSGASLGCVQNSAVRNPSHICLIGTNLLAVTTKHSTGNKILVINLIGIIISILDVVKGHVCASLNADILIVSCKDTLSFVSWVDESSLPMVSASRGNSIGRGAVMACISDDCMVTIHNDGESVAVWK